MEPETDRVFGRAYFLIQALEVVAREPQPDDSSEHQNKDHSVDHKDHMGLHKRIGGLCSGCCSPWAWKDVFWMELAEGCCKTVFRAHG